MKPEDKEEFIRHLASLHNHLKKHLKLKKTPKVYLVSDQKNADKILGKTAHYEPEKNTIRLNITDRHPKDILRSYSHEVVHHWQHEHKQLEKGSGEDLGPQYAQKNPWMRQMEKQAYLLGNILFRDWEDQKKNGDKKSGTKVNEAPDMDKWEWMIEAAFEEGANARYEGISKERNPYFRSNYAPEIKQQLADSWTRGWDMIDMDKDFHNPPPLGENYGKNQL